MANSDDNGLVGFRFNPTDQELVSYFLYQKVIAREPLPASYDGIVLECSLLGTTEPWRIWEALGGGPYLVNQEIYFFSELENTTPKASRFSRRIASGGTWREVSSSDVEVNGNSIGRKRNFRYENKGCRHHGAWLLEQYSIGIVADEFDPQAAKTVICRLKRSFRAAGYKRKNSTQESKIIEEPQDNTMIMASDDHQICFGGDAGAAADEEYLLDVNELLGITMEPTLKQEQHPLPTFGLGADNNVMTSDITYDPTCFGDAGTADEGYLFNDGELLGITMGPTLQQEQPPLPTFEHGADDTVVTSDITYDPTCFGDLLPTYAHGADEVAMQVWNPSSLEDILNHPLDYNAFWSNLSTMSQCPTDQ